MKKIFIFVIAFFTTFTLTAQFEWVGDFGQSSRTSGFYKTSNNQFIITRDTDDDAGFSVVDSSGDLIFNYSDPYLYNPGPSGKVGRLDEIFDFVELADSSYLFILLEYEYDCQGTGYADGFSRLLRFDRNWDEIDLSVPTISLFFSSVRFLAPLPDGTFLMLFSGSKEMQKRDPQGELIWSKNLPFYLEGIEDFLVVSGDTTVLATYENTYMLDGQGNVIETYGLIFDHIKPAPGGNFYGSLDDSLFLLTPSIEVLARSGLPGIIRDFASSDSTLAVLTSTNTVYVLDHGFNLLNSFQVDGHYPLKYIETLPSGIVAAGTTDFGGDTGRSWSPFLKEIPYSGDVLDNSGDIGVLGIEMIGSPTPSVPSFGEYQLTYDSLKITVQNFGDNTIDSLKLNSSFQSIDLNLGLCYFYQRPHKKYNNLSLQPGESRDLYWEDFMIAFREVPEGDFEICIWSSLPNQQIDRDSENDLYCTDFLVSDQETISDIGFTIYPNPSSYGSTIDYDLPSLHEGHVRVFSSMGILVGSYETGSGTGTMSLPKFPNGLYFIVLEMDDKVVRTLKFVQL